MLLHPSGNSKSLLLLLMYSGLNFDFFKLIHTYRYSTVVKNYPKSAVTTLRFSIPPKSTYTHINISRPHPQHCNPTKLQSK